MTPNDRDVIMSLVTIPGQPHRDTRQEVLRHFSTSDGQALGLSLLRDAAKRHDPVDVEMALIVGATFGFTPEYLDLLVQLSSADWHFKHEDVVSALGQLQTPAAVDALYRATQWVPAYLAFDESRAMARKAIWALGDTPGHEAEQALRKLAGSADQVIRREAENQLKRREARS
jgi:hypothetical protein